MLIMGWGPDVEVIHLVSLKKEILKLHQKCIEKIKKRLVPWHFTTIKKNVPTFDGTLKLLEGTEG